MSFTDQFYKSFDPEAAHDLHVAFRDAWNFVKESGGSSYLNDEAAEVCVARHVLAIARTGERDVRQLTNLAVAHFLHEHERALYEATLHTRKLRDVRNAAAAEHP
jgi:hypothetical protein